MKPSELEFRGWLTPALARAKVSLCLRRAKVGPSPLRRQFTCLKAALPYCSREGDFSCESPRVTYAQDGRYLRVSFQRSPAMEWNQEQFFSFGGKRGVCKGFSFGSRRRMMDRLNQVSVGADLPDFVTLTLPDESFEDCVSRFAKSAKLHLEVLLKRLARACPSACGFWRIEWKARKSGQHEGKLFPHFHLLIWGLGKRLQTVDETRGEIFQAFLPVFEPQKELAGLCSRIIEEDERAHVVFKRNSALLRFMSRMNRAEGNVVCPSERFPVNNFMSAFDWFSLAWYHVVGSGNTNHFLAGCRVESIRSWGGVLSYCAKYMSKADSENFLSDVSFGRSWGIFNRGVVPWAKMIELPVAEDVGIRLRRIACRYLSKQLGRRVRRSFGLTLYCDTKQWARLLTRPPDVPF